MPGTESSIQQALNKMCLNEIGPSNIVFDSLCLFPLGFLLIFSGVILLGAFIHVLSDETNRECFL